MSFRTVSEDLFELLCAQRSVACSRIPRDSGRTADYRVTLRQQQVVVEVKQLDPSPEETDLRRTWGTPRSPGALAPSDRIQGLLLDGYAQIKRSSQAALPAMIIVYNNSGPWNWIDSFTVSKAMLGSYAVVVGLHANREMDVVGSGYLGQRTVTKNTLRSLSAVGVIQQRGIDTVTLDCYHNPFASIPIDEASMSRLADLQYIHPNPHDRGFVPWEPKKI